jgi:hypothetical protein
MSDWKYRCNDQDVTEEVYLQVVQDHKEWAEDQYKKQQEAYKAAQKPEKSRSKK